MAALLKRGRIVLALAAIGLGALGVSSAPAATPPNTAYSIELNGAISPATEKWISSALDDAASSKAQIAIIRLDTPGGLDTSMRSIIKKIIAAPMPVVVYVYPNGARAASAGVYITEAADVAAMAPETNIGSATPISIGPGGPSDVLGHKIENDAAAYVRALASGHGRNPALAERMVRSAKNVTAAEAKKAGLIDVIAQDQQGLLTAIDGFHVKGPKAQVLHTAHLVISEHDMPFQYELLQVLVDPTIAFLLLTIGLIGIGFEVLAPGHIVPGAFGAVCLLLGLYGTAQLPVSAAGIALLVLAVVLLVAEAHFATHGALGVAGVAALIASGLLLFDTHSSAFEINAPVVIGTGLAIGAFIVLVISKVVAVRRRPVLTGHEELVGASCEVRVPLDPVGQVFVHGALWRARRGDDGERIEVGDRVRVESVDGLTLVVRPDDGPQEAKEGDG